MGFLIRMACWLAVAALGYWWFFYEPPVTITPGMAVTTVPQQIATDRAPWTYKNYQIRPLYQFTLDARVLGSRSYGDAQADLAPHDLTLGWQEMSDTTVLAQLDIQQMMRRWMWHTKGPYWPVPRDRIEHTAANMHIVPANDAVRHMLGRVREGQIIRLRGYLIAAQRPDGWHWNSSTSRTDTMDGSCELIWTESIEVIG